MKKGKSPRSYQECRGKNGEASENNHDSDEHCYDEKKGNDFGCVHGAHLVAGRRGDVDRDVPGSEKRLHDQGGDGGYERAHD